MGFIELLLLAIGLSMDAFAVSICKGLSLKKTNLESMAKCGLWFGGFQALMPLIGYLLGGTFQSYITSYDHWIAFVLLGFLGGKMIYEAITAGDEPANCSFAVREMFLMAVATSIDALAVGVTFALLPGVKIGWAVTFIGLLTFLLSAFGVKLGNMFGKKFKSKAEFLGGAILVLMGLKILLEHLEILNF